MTRDEFSDEYGKLCSAFGKKVNQVQSQEWFRRVKDAPIAIFSKAVKHIIDNDEKFPASAVYLRARVQYFLPEPKELTSCDHCLGGRIYYEYEKDGNVYETAAACDCESGDVISRQIIQRWKARGIDVKLPSSSRYSWLWQKYGGLETARRGLGMRVDQMPDPSQTKASLKGMDRGLSQMAVKAFAKTKNMGYEQAHEYLGRNAEKLFGIKRHVTVEQEVDEMLNFKAGVHMTTYG